MKRKIAFIDIDGTLNNSDGITTETTKKSIKNYLNHGGDIVLTSGRCHSDVVEKMKECGLSNYAISNTGALIYDCKNDEALFENPINYEAIESFWNFIKDSDVQIILNTSNGRYTNRHAIDNFVEKASVISDVKFLSDIVVYQIIVGSKEYDEFKRVQEFVLNTKGLTITYYSRAAQRKNENSKVGYFFDICSLGTSKGNAIKFLLNYLKLSRDESISFGDNISDISMFDVTGMSVVPENGKPEAKEKADVICPSNDADGISQILDSLID